MDTITTKLLAGGRPLAEVTTVSSGEATGLDDAFVLDQATRNQAVIYDPSCAPLFAPLLRAEDLRPWYAANEGYWLLAIPAGWTAARFGDGLGEDEAWQRLTRRHQSVAWQLEPFAEAARARATQGDYWWELAPRTEAAPGVPPKICWPAVAAQPCFVWDESAGRVGDGGFFAPNATPELLGLLASRVAWFVLTCGGLPITRLPIPALAEAERAAIGDLARRISAEARERYALHRAARRRLLADLGPPGVKLSPALAAWWELDFPTLRAELVRAFKNDIPLRYRDEWEDWLVAQRRAHDEHTAAIVALETDLNTRVYAGFDLTPAEIARIEAATLYQYGTV